jgi:hypothetical protein
MIDRRLKPAGARFFIVISLIKRHFLGGDDQRSIPQSQRSPNRSAPQP